VEPARPKKQTKRNSKATVRSDTRQHQAAKTKTQLHLTGHRTPRKLSQKPVSKTNSNRVPVPEGFRVSQLRTCMGGGASAVLSVKTYRGPRRGGSA
jgi:hypothetical protein